MRVLFMGTPEFAATSLKALLSSSHEVVGVWTRADRPHGRGHRLIPSPVKALAMEVNLPVFQPRTLRKPGAAEPVAELAPEVICVAAYGLILPPEVLSVPSLGCINVHASLLPHYRGAAPIQRAVMAGETETGITTMLMDEGLDTGDMLLKEAIPIGPEKTAGEVEEQLAGVGARLLLETLQRLEQGNCPRTPQDDRFASWARPVTKEECRIDWRLSAREVHNRVRGTTPRPGSFTVRDGQPLRVHRTRVVDEVMLEEFVRRQGPLGAPGEARVLDRELIVCCGAGALVLSSVQPAGKNVMSGAEYLRGRPFQPGATVLLGV